MAKKKSPVVEPDSSEKPEGEVASEAPPTAEEKADQASDTQATEEEASEQAGEGGEEEAAQRVNEGDRKIAIIVRITITEIDDEGNARKVKEQVIASSRKQKDKVQYELGFREIDKDGK